MTASFDEQDACDIISSKLDATSRLTDARHPWRSHDDFDTQLNNVVVYLKCIGQPHNLGHAQQLARGIRQMHVLPGWKIPLGGEQWLKLDRVKRSIGAWLMAFEAKCDYTVDGTKAVALVSVRLPLDDEHRVALESLGLDDAFRSLAVHIRVLDAESLSCVGMVEQVLDVFSAGGTVRIPMAIVSSQWLRVEIRHVLGLRATYQCPCAAGKPRR